MDLDGRHVLLTGASRGVGAALAEELAAAGARLALVARDADALAGSAARLGGRAYATDLTDPDQLRSLVARVEADGGPVDALVNNAGVESAGALTDQSADDIEQLLRLNLLAPAELCRQVLPGMVARRRGHLVLVSSLAAVGTFPGLAVYGASKAGLTRLASGLHLDLRGQGVGVTDVQLGPIRGEMLTRAKAHPPTARGFARLRRLRTLRDLDPAEVAAAVVAAVRGNRRHVRLPRRTAIAGAWAEAPQRVVEILLSGRPRGAGR